MQDSDHEKLPEVQVCVGCGMMCGHYNVHVDIKLLPMGEGIVVSCHVYFSLEFFRKNNLLTAA